MAIASSDRYRAKNHIFEQSRCDWLTWNSKI